MWVLPAMDVVIDGGVPVKSGLCQCRAVMEQHDEVSLFTRFKRPDSGLLTANIRRGLEISIVGSYC